MGLLDFFEITNGPSDIISRLNKFLTEREKSSEPRTGWHPSSFCGMCPRAYVIKKLVKDPVEPLDPGLIRLFDTGHAHHYWYQNVYFGPMGVLWGPWKCLSCSTVTWGFRPGEKCPHCGENHFLYEEIPVSARLPGCVEPVNGHADGLILLGANWYVLEIKTINSNAYKWLNGAKDSHLKQAQIYCELIRQGHVLGIPFGVKLPMPVGIVFLYISKNDTDLKAFVVDADPDIGRFEMQNPIKAEKALQTRVLPERLAVCTKKSEKRPQACGEKDRCFSDVTFEKLFSIGLNK